MSSEVLIVFAGAFAVSAILFAALFHLSERAEKAEAELRRIKNWHDTTGEE